MAFVEMLLHWDFILQILHTFAQKLKIRISEWKKKWKKKENTFNGFCWNAARVGFGESNGTNGFNPLLVQSASK